MRGWQARKTVWAGKVQKRVSYLRRCPKDHRTMDSLVKHKELLNFQGQCRRSQEPL